MSHRRPPALHADLLLALSLAEGDALQAQRLAALLGFAPRPVSARPNPVEQAQPAEQSSRPNPGRRRKPSPRADTGPTPPLRAWLPVLTRVDVPPDEQGAREDQVPDLTEADCLPRLPGAPPAALPLMARASLWPALRRSVSLARSAGLDVRAVVRGIASGHLFRRWPRVQHHSFAGQLWVLHDLSQRLAPYQADFQDFVDELLHLRGATGLTLWHFINLPDHTVSRTDASQCVDWQAGLPAPPCGMRVLVLSDLGATAAGPGLERAWARHLAGWRRAGAEVAVWSPVSSRQVPATLAGLASVRGLADRASLRVQRGAWANLAQRQAAHARLNALSESLHTLVSCAVELSPALLRELRLLLPETAREPALEAVYWQSEAVVPSEACRVLKPDAAAEARVRFQSLDDAVQLAVLRTLQSHHAHSGRSTEATEASLWRAHASASARQQAEVAGLLTGSQDWWRRLTGRLSRASALGDAALHGFARDVLRRQRADARWQDDCCEQVAALAACLDDVSVLPPHLAAHRLLQARRRIGLTGSNHRRWRLIQRGSALWAWPAEQELPGRALALMADAVVASEVVLTTGAGDRRLIHLQGQEQLLIPRLLPGLEVELGFAGATVRLSLQQRPPWAEGWARRRTRLTVEARWPWGTPMHLVSTPGQRWRHGELAALRGTAGYASAPRGQLARIAPSPALIHLYRATTLSGVAVAEALCDELMEKAARSASLQAAAIDLSMAEIVTRLNGLAHPRDAHARWVVMILNGEQLSASDWRAVDLPSLERVSAEGRLHLALVLLTKAPETSAIEAGRLPLLGLANVRSWTVPIDLDAEASARLARGLIDWLLLANAPELSVSDEDAELMAVASWAAQSDPFGLSVRMKVMTVDQVFRYIPPGEFWMGSPDVERAQIRDKRYKQWAQNEAPRHRVRLTEGFWLADTACTQALWLAVMGGDNPSHFKDDPQNPVEQVSWDDVQAFLQRLQALLPDGCEAGLPTEAEWEYACRAGTQTPWHFGDRIHTDQVNFSGKEEFEDAKATLGPSRGKTVPVKSLPPNDWGLFEMHGNVYEWCADGDLRDYGQARSGEVIENPIQPPEQGTESLRVVRGGSWILDARLARSAYRIATLRGRRYRLLGFRLALRSSSTSPPAEGPDGPDRVFAPGRDGPGPADRRDAGTPGDLAGERPKGDAVDLVFKTKRSTSDGANLNLRFPKKR